MHRMAIAGHAVCDLHCDLFEFSRRYRRDPRRRHRKVPWFFTEGHTDMPRLADAGVDVVLCGIYAPLLHGERAWRVTNATLAFIDEVAPPLAKRGALVTQGTLRFAPALEGAHLLGGRPERVAEVAARGVVSIGIAHLGPNDCATHRGLTSLGREVVAACEEEGVLVDLAHASPAAFWETLDATAGEVFVSHSGARSVHRHPRMLADDQIRAIADRGGVIGVMFYPLYLKGRFWGTVDDVVDHLEAIVGIGGTNVAALGSDWDGAITTPRGLEEPSGLRRLVDRLEARWLAHAVPGILGGNFLTMWS